MEKELSLGPMEENTLVNIKTIKNMAKEYLFGLMVGSMTENGKKENNTEKEPTMVAQMKDVQVFGKMEEELDGLRLS